MSPRIKSFLSPVLATVALLSVAPNLARGQAGAGQPTEPMRPVKQMQMRMLLEEGRAHIERARAEAPRSTAGKGPAAKARRGKSAKATSGVRARRAPLIDEIERAGARALKRLVSPTGVLGTNALGPNVLVNDTTGDFDTAAGQAEVAIAAYGNYVLAAFNDGNGFTFGGDLQGYAYSTDGGLTFTDGGTIPRPSINARWTSDPVVTVNEKTGEFYYVGLINPTSTTNGVGIVRATFSGSSIQWSTPVVIRTVNNTTDFIDKPWAVADSSSGRIHVAYTRFFGTTDAIEFQRSTTAWNLFGSPIQLNNATANGRVQGARTAVGPDGELYAIWKEIGPIDQDFLRIRKSLDQGQTFGPERLAAGIFDNFGTGAPGFNRERGITFPAIAVDRNPGPNRGRAYVTWNESINWYRDLPPPNGLGNLGEAGDVNEVEFNDVFGAPGVPTPFTPGVTLHGAFSTITDIDLFQFTATQGKTYTFWCDTIPKTLYSMRVICSDTTSRLNLTGDFDPPAGDALGFITWTCPRSGTYYLRMFGNLPGSQAGIYRVLTGENTPGPEPGRDQRDIMVVSSPDGVTWSSPTRVNQDPPYFDNWLPEVAVGGDGNEYAIWYGFYEAPDTTCGGESHVYLSRSSDGGASWNLSGRLTDAISPWTRTFSNIQPNQGDYLGLYASTTTLYPAWTDGRFGNPDIFTSPIPYTTTPALVSLASADAQPDRITVTWYSAAGRITDGYVYRFEGDDWVLKTAITKDGQDRLVYVDTDVWPGTRYRYRLGIRDGDRELFFGEVSVVAPSRSALAIESVLPNPTGHDVWVSFTLPVEAPATLSLWDVAGRRVRDRSVGALGLGRHLVNLGEGHPLPAGVYLVELSQAGRTQSARVAVVR